MQTSPGIAYPFGATLTQGGVNFAVFSENATAMDLCLFDGKDDERPRHVIGMWRTHDVFHAFVQGLGPGTLYALRAHGPWVPSDGHMFNEHKLLLDPYARELSSLPQNDERLRADDRREAFGVVPKGVVHDGGFDWQGDTAPRIAWRDSLIYECHVKGMTALHPDVSADERGRYLGLAHPRVIEHL
jgi:isoamylase